MTQFFYVILVVSLLGCGSGGPYASRSAPGKGPRGPRGVPGARGGCRCVPHQWEGTLSTTEREFDWTEGAALDKDTSTKIHYDYLARLFATTDVETGVKSIVDHKNGLRYVIKPSGVCRVSPTSDVMVRMCLPDGASVVREYRIGLDIPVSVWHVALPGNVTLRTTVLKRLCLPLSEETFMSNRDYATLTSSMYVNVTLGIADPAVFHPPKGCSRGKSHEDGGE